LKLKKLKSKRFPIPPLKTFLYTSISLRVIIHDTDYIIVVEVAASTGEHLIQGLNVELEPDWGLRVDFLKQLFADKLTRMVLSKEYDLEIDKGPFEHHGISN
jgi:hypothetical protein